MLKQTSDGKTGKEYLKIDSIVIYLKLKEFIANFINLSKGANNHFNTLVILLVINILVAAIGFLTRIVMANKLGAIDFGLLSYSIAISAYVETIVRYGTDKTLVRDVVCDEKRASVILASSIFLKIILFCFCIFLIKLYTSFNNNEILLMVIVGSSLLSFESKGVYDATNNIRRHSIYYAIYRLLYYGMIWLPIVAINNVLTVQYIGIAMILSAMVYIIVQHVWIFNRYTLKNIDRVSVYRYAIQLFYENFSICFAALCGLGLIAFNQIVLKEYCGARELGVYAAAWQFFWVGNLFVVQLSRVGQPILAKKLLVERKEISIFVLKYITIMLVTVLPISIPLIFFPGVIVDNLFSEEYIQAIVPLRIIGLYTIVISVDMVITQYLIILKKNRLYMIVMSLSGAISMVLSWAIIPKLQASGAAISLFASHALAISVLGYFVFKDVSKTCSLAQP